MEGLGCQFMPHMISSTRTIHTLTASISRITLDMGQKNTFASVKLLYTIHSWISNWEFIFKSKLLVPRQNPAADVGRRPVCHGNSSLLIKKVVRVVSTCSPSSQTYMTAQNIGSPDTKQHFPSVHHRGRHTHLMIYYFCTIFKVLNPITNFRRSNSSTIGRGWPRSLAALSDHLIHSIVHYITPIIAQCHKWWGGRVRHYHWLIRNSPDEVTGRPAPGECSRATDTILLSFHYTVPPLCFCLFLW